MVSNWRTWEVPRSATGYPMTKRQDEKEYVLGTDRVELERLGL